MGGSRGPASACGYAVRRMEGMARYFCLLNQDTDLPKSQFTQAAVYIDSVGTDVLMPLVTTGEVILSSCRTLGPWCRSIRRPGQLPRQFNCINSGMVLRVRPFDTCSFDERPSLDYMKHHFVKSEGNVGARIHRCGIVISIGTTRCIPTHRFELQSLSESVKKDLRAFYSAELVGRTWYRPLVFRRSIVLAPRYRPLDFLRVK